MGGGGGGDGGDGGWCGAEVVIEAGGGAEVEEEDGDGGVNADTGDGGEVAEAREVLGFPTFLPLFLSLFLSTLFPTPGRYTDRHSRVTVAQDRQTDTHFFTTVGYLILEYNARQRGERYVRETNIEFILLDAYSV